MVCFAIWKELSRKEAPMSESSKDTPAEEHWKQWFETCSALRCCEEAKTSFSKFAFIRYKKNLHLANDDRQTGIHGEMRAILDSKNSADGVSAAWLDFELMGWRKVKRERGEDSSGRTVSKLEAGSTKDEDDLLYRCFKEALKEKTAKRVRKDGIVWLTALEIEASLQIRTRTTNLNRWARKEDRELVIRDDPTQLKRKEGRDEVSDKKEFSPNETPGPAPAPLVGADVDDFAAGLVSTVKRARHGRTLFLAMFDDQKPNSPELGAALGLRTSQVYVYWNALEQTLLDHFRKTKLGMEELLPVVASAAAMLEKEPENLT